jgi:hypothetical protein
MVEVPNLLKVGAQLHNSIGGSQQQLEALTTPSNSQGDLFTRVSTIKT